MEIEQHHLMFFPSYFHIKLRLGFHVHVIRPTNDIALLIMSSLPSKIRRDNQQKLLDLYYTELKQNLAWISIDLEVTLHYSKEKLLEDYK